MTGKTSSPEQHPAGRSLPLLRRCPTDDFNAPTRQLHGLTLTVTTSSPVRSAMIANTALVVPPIVNYSHRSQRPPPAINPPFK